MNRPGEVVTIDVTREALAKVVASAIRSSVGYDPDEEAVLRAVSPRLGVVYVERWKMRPVGFLATVHADDEDGDEWPKRVRIVHDDEQTYLKSLRPWSADYPTALSLVQSVTPLEGLELVSWSSRAEWLREASRG